MPDRDGLVKATLAVQRLAQAREQVGLLPVRTGQSQGAAVVALGFLVCVQGQRRVAGPHKVRQRVLGVSRLLKVTCQHGGIFVQPVRIEMFQRFTHHPVQALAVRRQQRGIGRVLHQRVPEQVFQFRFVLCHP